ncbi:hypothetical protein HYU89_03320 [Candidatus Collierbacteria bacterium]|nr:hypothetical protein [Candidatus Collierbacteria bacterium]
MSTVRLPRSKLRGIFQSMRRNPAPKAPMIKPMYPLQQALRVGRQAAGFSGAGAKKVLFFSRDPGGANCIIPVFKRLAAQKTITPILWGKDYSIIRYGEEKLKYKDISYLNTFQVISFLQSKQVKFILTGTSYGDYSEQKLWKLARKLHIPTAAIVDQWLNYRLRFTSLAGRIITPDKILVLDNFARKEMIGEGFQKAQLLVVGHPSFDLLGEMVGWDKKNVIRHRLSILFICDAIEQAVHVNFGYTEKTIITELLTAFESVNYSDKIDLVIKLHPKNDLDAMRMFIKRVSLPKLVSISLTKTTPLHKLILISDLVIGMYSMGLVEAYLLGKPVMSVQIGLRKEDEFILSRRGVTRTIRSSQILIEEFNRFFLKKRVRYKKRFPIVPHAGENVIKFIIDTINRK